MRVNGIDSLLEQAPSGRRKNCSFIFPHWIPILSVLDSAGKVEDVFC